MTHMLDGKNSLSLVRFKKGIVQKNDFYREEQADTKKNLKMFSKFQTSCSSWFSKFLALYSLYIK
jgi:hypothetical protein